MPPQQGMPPPGAPISGEPTEELTASGKKKKGKSKKAKEPKEPKPPKEPKAKKPK